MITRNATANDAQHLAILINEAGEGLPRFLWRRMAGPGQDPFEIGAARAAREEGSFSYRHARIAEFPDVVAGMVLGYPLPDPYPVDDLEHAPEVIRPLLELEALVPGSWYINAIATYADFRGRGVASRLMSETEDRALAWHAKRLSLIVASENRAAHALYLKLGYREISSRPLVAFPGGPGGGRWLLLTRELG
jgi:ribosomal protein S18 acetylase RimI-like enzyme